MTIKIAKVLFAKHNLTGWKWSISTKMSSHGGMCHHRTKHITISHLYIKQATIYQTAELILHEIAHALVDPKEKPHGKVWKQTALRIGSIASASYKTLNPKQLKFIKDIVDPIIYPKIVITPMRRETLNPKARDETLKRLNRTHAKPRQTTIDKWKLIRNAQGLWV